MNFTPLKEQTYMYIDGYKIVEAVYSSPIAPKPFEFGSPSQTVSTASAPKLVCKQKNKPPKKNNRNIISNINPCNKENIKKRKTLSDALIATPNKLSPEELAAAQLNAQNVQQDISPLAEILNENGFMHQPQPNNIFDEI
jgi:hypothetical protein